MNGKQVGIDCGKGNPKNDWLFIIFPTTQEKNSFLTGELTAHGSTSHCHPWQHTMLTGLFLIWVQECNGV